MCAPVDCGFIRRMCGGACFGGFFTEDMCMAVTCGSDFHAHRWRRGNGKEFGN